MFFWVLDDLITSSREVEEEILGRFWISILMQGRKDGHASWQEGSELNSDNNAELSMGTTKRALDKGFRPSDSALFSNFSVYDVRMSLANLAMVVCGLFQAVLGAE